MFAIALARRRRQRREADAYNRGYDAGAYGPNPGYNQGYTYGNGYQQRPGGVAPMVSVSFCMFRVLYRWAQLSWRLIRGHEDVLA